MRLVLVYGYEPSGHSSAALALEAAARFLGHEARRVNISADYHPVLGPALAGTYLQVVQKAPGLWDYLYDNPALLAAAQGLRRFYLLMAGGKLQEALSHLKPEAIVCTHAPPLGFLAARKGKGEGCPVVAAITDYGVHSYWANPQADLYLVAGERSAQDLSSRGVPPAKIRVTGIPIHPIFAEPLDRACARRAFGLAPQARVLLLTGGSRGLGALEGMVRSLLEELGEVFVLAACGNNRELHESLASAGDPRIKAYGTLEPGGMRELLAASDLVIGKGGGLTAAEAMALGVPMLIVDPIPGQEERNAEFLTRQGAALRAGPSQVGRQVRALLEHPDRLERLAQKARALGRPDSARACLEAILQTAAVA